MPRGSSDTDPGWPMGVPGDGGGPGLAGIFNCLKQELIASSIPCLHVVQQHPTLLLVFELCCQCWGWLWFLSMQREGCFAMGKGQLLLQPGAVLAAGALRVSDGMVPAAVSAAGWAGSWLVSVPSPGRAISVWPALRLCSQQHAQRWRVVLGAGTAEAAAGPLCGGARTSAARRPMLIHALC